MLGKLATALIALVYLTLVGGAISFFASQVSGADTDDAKVKDKLDRDRRAKAAVAVAMSMPQPAAVGKGVAVAPSPRPVTPKDYAAGYKDATLDQLPLVVYVSCDGPRVEGAVTCVSKSDTFGDVKGPAVVVGYPQGNRVMIDSTLACPATAGELKKAVESAAKKIDGPPAKQMPAPVPLNTQIRAEPGPCICGESCKCEKGSCPGKCPVQLASAPPAPAFAVVPTPVFGPLPSGYRWQSTVQGHGIVGPNGAWYVEPSPDHTSRLAAGYFYTPCPEANNFPRGFWVSPCIKDENCKVIQCNIPPVGQHGEPTGANAEAVATARGNSFQPNGYQGGYQRVLTPCGTGNCPVAVTSSPVPAASAPTRVLVGYEQRKVCQGNGTCRIVNVPVYADRLP